MRLFPAEPRIDIYEEGFEDHDLLDRAPLGARLSRLLDAVDDPQVVAVDGGWGTGKSFFLKCWVGAHTLENEGKAQTVYFDAFLNDYGDDPLIPLTSEIETRFPGDDEGNKAWQRAKLAAAKLWRPVVRMSIASASAGLSELTGPVLDAAINEAKDSSKEAVDEFWSRVDARRAAIEDFRGAIRDLVGSTGERGLPERKLIVVVDELDRCRPDYALSLLETIKHFFSEPGVHFVLGVNLAELENMVRARYGGGTNAKLYLQKFISLSFALPDRDLKDHGLMPLPLAYFDRKADEMGVEDALFKLVRRYLELEPVARAISLRSVNRILSSMILIQAPEGDFSKLVIGYQVLVSGLIILRAVFPEQYQLARQNRLTFDAVSEVFGFQKDTTDTTPHWEALLHYVWATFLEPDRIQGNWPKVFGPFGVPDPKRELVLVIDDRMEQYNLS